MNTSLVAGALALASVAAVGFSFGDFPTLSVPPSELATLRGMDIDKTTGTENCSDRQGLSAACSYFSPFGWYCFQCDRTTVNVLKDQLGTLARYKSNPNAWQPCGYVSTYPCDWNGTMWVCNTSTSLYQSQTRCPEVQYILATQPDDPGGGGGN